MTRILIAGVAVASLCVSLAAQAPKAEKEPAPAKPAALPMTIGADADAMPICDAVAGGCVTGREVRQLIAERARGQRSTADQLAEQLGDVQDQLTQARMERANCETTLGPLELSTRRSDSRERWGQIKKLIEDAHPGYVYDPATKKLSPKPLPPPSEPEKK
jgi:hypothetical protein